mgnify:CR=1 FL=1
MKQNFEERRSHPRIEKNVPLKIKDDRFDIVTETKNISCSGAYCIVNQYLAPMTKVAITLLIPIPKSDNKTVIKKIKCQGVVVRTEPNFQTKDGEYKIAIFFNQIGRKDMQDISSYVNFHLSNMRPISQNN